jgi:hypothetical protein
MSYFAFLFLLIAPLIKAEVYTAWPFEAKEASRRQSETAKTLGVPAQLTVDLGNGVALKLVLIPRAGS